MTYPIDEINAVNKDCYDHQADRWLRFPFKEILPKWVKHYQPQGAKALDIGSGNGHFAKWLQENGFEVLCLDPSTEMAQRCRAKGLKTIETTLQDYREKETFDAIFAICSLIHIPKKEWPAEIDKIASLLNQGGYFYLALIEGKGEGYFEQEFEFPRFFSYFQREEVLEYLKERFELLEWKRVTGQTNYLLFALSRK